MNQAKNSSDKMVCWTGFVIIALSVISGGIELVGKFSGVSPFASHQFPKPALLSALFCLGVALVAGSKRAGLVARIFSATAFLIAGCSFVLNFASKRDGVTQFLGAGEGPVVRAWYLAPNTALVVATLASAIVSMIAARPNTRLIKVLGAAALAISLFSILGHLTGLQSGYRWGQFEPMHPMMGIIGIAIASTAIFWAAEKGRAAGHSSSWSFSFSP